MKKLVIIPTTIVVFFSLIFILDLSWFVRLLIYIISCLSIFAGCIVVMLVLWRRYEEAMEQRAKRKATEKESNITVVTAPEGHQVYIRDTDHNAVVRPLHLMPGYSNSKPMHNETDERRWIQYQATRRLSVIKDSSKLLPETMEQRVSHFYELLDTYPHLMIIAPSGSGKSTQISLAANYFLQQKPNSRLVWMSTHALEDKKLIHPKAVIVQSVDNIVMRLNEIVTVYEYRRDNPQNNYKQIIVVLDEWYDLIMSNGDVKNAVSQLSSEARKFGIVLILASHTDNVSDTGINKNIRRNFARVRLDANLTKQNKAIWMRFDKQDTWQEIELPKRREIARQLVNNGMSKNQAAIVVYERSYGGNLVEKF